jgi:hypothetical protein
MFFFLSTFCSIQFYKEILFILTGSQSTSLALCICTDSHCVHLFDAIKLSSSANLNEHYKKTYNIHRGETFLSSEIESNVES